MRPAANAAAEVLREVGAAQLELQFGVELAGEAGAITAQNCSEAHFIVRLSFAHRPPPQLSPEEEIIL
ncbi:CU044_2847 family protein [Arthrobacter sp. AL12]|nr:CU044_2847 family protein [Arthrobacter sp. AL12]MDI3211970.1 CU044_2847 family protein [Arthrobacter sp. AL12]